MLNTQKRIMCLALISVAIAANAQVKVSGNIDVGAAYVNEIYQVKGGGPGRNNLTFSGSEDLGDGASAFFYLNSRFNPDDGTVSYGANNAASQPFFRQLWVGFQNKLGDIRLGRMLVPHQQFNGSYEPWQTYTIASTNTGGNLLNVRANDTIYYRSASIGGLKIHLSTSDPQSQGHPASVNKRQLGFGAQYIAGPASLAIAWDRDAGDLKTQGVYVKYTVGIVTGMAEYERIDLNRLTGTESKRWSAGALIPVGVNTFKAGYKHVTDDITLGTRTQKKYAIGVEHSLSKRTFLYADCAKTSGQGLTAVQGKTQWDAGISHAF
jgi:predicted porin